MNTAGLLFYLVQLKGLYVFYSITLVMLHEAACTIIFCVISMLWCCDVSGEGEFSAKGSPHH
jgi:hypothetical protein